MLARAAIHESGHACCVLRFELPLRDVYICEDGTGGMLYSRRLRNDELVDWTIVAFAGPEAERDLFGDADESGDLTTIEKMLRRRDLLDCWNAAVLARYRRIAEALVKRESAVIEIVAEALMEHRRLSGDQVATLIGAQ